MNVGVALVTQSGRVTLCFAIAWQQEPFPGAPPQAGAGVMPQLLHSSVLAWTLAASSGRTQEAPVSLKLLCSQPKTCNASVICLILIQCPIFLS